jgi:leucyl/phenylalanyl-tRNA--protein transferase
MPLVRPTLALASTRPPPPTPRSLATVLRATARGTIAAKSTPRQTTALLGARRRGVRARVRGRARAGAGARVGQAPMLILDRRDPPEAFPPVERALESGLLAIGGDLSLARLRYAYRHGIFPWFSEGDPILWFSPDPRTVFLPDQIKVSRSLRKRLKQQPFELTVDRDFAGVIDGCAAPRAKADGTWITVDMRAAYLALHRAGHAHSVECWQQGALVGGLYGVAVGRVFCGESMFSRAPDASKIALVHLGALGFALIDGQVPNPFLSQMGAIEIARADYLALLAHLRDEPGPLDRPR